MRFVFGKSDWIDLKRGEEQCFLMTNGLGGFSSQTIIGSCSRNDHAVFMACTHSPNHRWNMIHLLEEAVSFEGEKESVELSSQAYQKEKNKEGYFHQDSFIYEDFPIFTYRINGVEITKEMVLMQGRNALGLRYEIHNGGRVPVRLAVTPGLQFVKKGEKKKDGQQYFFEDSEAGLGKVSSEGQDMYVATNGTYKVCPEELVEGLFYAYDERDGKHSAGWYVKNHQIWMEVGSEQNSLLEIVYSLEEELPSFEEIKASVISHRQEIAKRAGFLEDIPKMLSMSAGQFLSKRASTGGETILAGFPFFEDWGRDTMISLSGICLSTRQYDSAVSILRTFMKYCKKGLLPNLFPEGNDEPWYNTADASLLFVITAFEYFQRTKDAVFLAEAYPTMKEIVYWYKKGTDYGIHMDEDGLIMAGKDLAQVTWMDVCIEGILPTPRHGKPVEINAYWYNVLCIMEECKKFCQEAREDEEEYALLAEKVRKSFQEKFLLEEKHCLKDVISGTKADNQIRCNQIWAVSLPFSVLDREQEKEVVKTVYEKLYTPYGLRTLEREDEEFHPTYEGPQKERDMAYHQGTVWVFPLGGYYLAYLKVHDYKEEAVKTVRKQLEVMEAALREGCVGQLPEIYDGAYPTVSKGCFAQAWSIGEILRVYDALERAERRKGNGV